MHHEPAESSTNKQTQRAEAELPLWPSDELTSHSTSQPTTTSLTDNDESAIAGLLALGTSTNDMMGADLSMSEFAISPPAARQGPFDDQAMIPSTDRDFSAFLSPAQLSHSSQPSLEVSPTETLELLRHYRYEVAPWVSALVNRKGDEKLTIPVGHL